MDPILVVILFFILGGIFISAIMTSIEIKKHRPVEKATEANQYIVPGEAIMSEASDTFLRTNVQRRRIVQQQQKSSQGGHGGRPRR